MEKDLKFLWEGIVSPLPPTPEYKSPASPDRSPRRTPRRRPRRRSPPPPPRRRSFFKPSPRRRRPKPRQLFVTRPVVREPELVVPRDPTWIPPTARRSTASEPKLETHFHSDGMAVLCMRGDGFTLTNGFVSHSATTADHLVECIRRLGVGRLFLTDYVTKLRWKMVDANLPLVAFILEETSGFSECPYCKSVQCHRHVAVVNGISRILKYPVQLIPH